jgi:hypothetical protein
MLDDVDTRLMSSASLPLEIWHFVLSHLSHFQLRQVRLLNASFLTILCKTPLDQLTFTARLDVERIHSINTARDVQLHPTMLLGPWPFVFIKRNFGPVEEMATNPPLVTIRLDFSHQTYSNWTIMDSEVLARESGVRVQDVLEATKRFASRQADDVVALPESVSLSVDSQQVRLMVWVVVFPYVISCF